MMYRDDSHTSFIGHRGAHLFFWLMLIRRCLWLGVTRKRWQGEYLRTSCFLKKSSGTRMMPISRMYRFSNWQNALNCLIQEPCAPPEDARNLGRFGNSAGELPNH